MNEALRREMLSEAVVLERPDSDTLRKYRVQQTRICLLGFGYGEEEGKKERKEGVAGVIGA